MRTLSVLALSCAIVLSVEAAEPAFRRVTLPENPSEAQVKSYLAALESAIILEFEHTTETAMYKSQSVYRPSPEVLQELYGKFSILPITHLALICKACAKSESLLFAQLVADSFSARDDYRPEDKAILVKYLSSIPKLIVVLDRKDWLDVSDPVVLKAWKEAERNSHEGVLDTVGYRFAAMGARRGLKEGLLALAESVQGRARQSASPMRDAGLKTDTGVLRMLFPSDLEGAALGEFVLKNKKTISYDATKRSYALKS